MSLQQLSKEEFKEMSFIEVAKLILQEKKEPMLFSDIVNEIGAYLELSESEVRTKMLQFYTDLNIDGSFLTLGENRWGLREWYPFDQIDEEVIIPVKPKKKKKKAVVEEEYDFEEDYEEDFDEEDFDEEDDIDDDEEADESLEQLREEEEEEFEEEDEYEIDEDELEIDEDLEDEEDDLELDEEEED